MPFPEGSASAPIRVAQAIGGANNTYAAVLHERLDASFSLKNDPLLAYAFRSTLRSAVHTAWLNEGDSAVYTATVSAGQVAAKVAANQETFLNPGCLNLVTASSVPAGFAPHGQRLFPGRHGLSDPQRGWWMDASSGLNIIFTEASIGVGSFTIVVYASNGREWQPVAESIVDAGHLTYSFIIAPHNPGYFSFGVRLNNPIAGPSNASDLFYTMQLQVGRGVGQLQQTTYCHRAMPGISNNLADLPESRVISGSAMITNRAAQLQLGGQVMACAMPAGQTWQRFTFDYVNQSQDSFSAQGTKGVYAFLRPATLASFGLVNEYMPTDAGDLPLGGIPTLTDAAFIIPLQDEGVALTFLYPNTPGAQSGFYTFAFNMEAGPNNPLFPKEPSQLREQDVRHAINFASRLQQFYTNEDHTKSIFEEIWEGVKGFASNVASTITEYGPSVVDAAKFILPLLV